MNPSTGLKGLLSPRNAKVRFGKTSEAFLISPLARPRLEFRDSVGTVGNWPTC